ncbi:MAG: acyl-CoA dehydrogenase family protein [Acidobacteriota bacterium]
MDFALTAELRAVQEAFRAFAEREVRPAAAELDRNPRFPNELFRRAGELGLFGMRYPEPDGSGADVVSYVLAIEQLARGSLSVAAACALQSLMGTTFVQRFAKDEVRARLLPGALRGEIVGAICMTEPDAGSDLMAMTTRAVERDGRFCLTGCKTWVTSARAAQMFTVFAKTGEKSLSVFLVEAGAPGLSIGKDIDKMGVRASLTSEVSFDDTPATCLLGERDAGGTYLREVLAEIRVMTAALALGVAAAAHEQAVAYAAVRKQFGKPIKDHQAVQEHLAEMTVDLEAARRLTYWAAWRSDQKLPNENEAAMAKLFASEAALRICDRAARVMASYGFASEYPVERYLRDVRFTLIGGGTSEILRGAIARGLYP